jgi:hypothetical protein
MALQRKKRTGDRGIIDKYNLVHRVSRIVPHMGEAFTGRSSDLTIVAGNLIACVGGEVVKDFFQTSSADQGACIHEIALLHCGNG